jgi:hypothetical protein
LEHRNWIYCHILSSPPDIIKCLSIIKKINKIAMPLFPILFHNTCWLKWNRFTSMWMSLFVYDIMIIIQSFIIVIIVYTYTNSLKDDINVLFFRVNIIMIMCHPKGSFAPNIYLSAYFILLWLCFFFHLTFCCWREFL